MQAPSRMKLWREGQVNSFLLCTVLAKQTRRLERLMPDRRIPELIMLALTNCADYELALDVDAGVPGVVREEAMQLGRLTRAMGQESDCRCSFGPWWARRDRR